MNDFVQSYLLPLPKNLLGNFSINFSANTGENIDEAFETLSRLILHNTFGVEPLPATLPRKETFLAYAKKLEERGYMIEVGSKIKPKCTIQ